MSDDLVARLRAGGETCGADTCKVKDASSGCLCALAADRIEQLEAVLLDANNTLAAAFARIHCLPRTTDTNLATKIGKTRAAIHAALEWKDG